MSPVYVWPLTFLYSWQMDAAQRQLNDLIDDATQRLLGTARLLTDPDLREPSLLPGWTRGHVLAHVAGSADAMRSLLAGARPGRTARPTPARRPAPPASSRARRRRPRIS